MSVILGLDLGTTTVTALALASDSGDLLARVTVPNQADITSAGDRTLGRSVWDASAILATACQCLRAAADQMGASWSRLAGLCLTGQQHGGFLVDSAMQPLTPLVNWQDRRGEDRFPGQTHTFTEEISRRWGESYRERTGCRVATGFLATTLFWWKVHDHLPPSARACFLTDYVGALLTGSSSPVTDPTFAASAGVYDVRAGAWAEDLMAALGLDVSCLPEVRPSAAPLGTLTSMMAEETGLPEGLPIFVGVGDNQASFVGSVADRQNAELVNIGTGGQVSVYSESFHSDPILETRPFPGGGYLLACVGLTGGRTYALLEQFFRQVGTDFFDMAEKKSLYSRMNELAELCPPGADGLRCEPYFTGTRHDPTQRASWTGMSAENFTPAHLTRALLEGMARALHRGHEAIATVTGVTLENLIGAGNGVRENRLLVRLIGEAFGRPVQVPRHREEAAYGAALLAGLGAGVFADLEDTGSRIWYV